MTVQLSCLLKAEAEEGNVYFGSTEEFLIRVSVGVNAAEDGTICQLDGMCVGLVSPSAEAMWYSLMVGRRTLLNVLGVVFTCENQGTAGMQTWLKGRTRFA